MKTETVLKLIRAAIIFWRFDNMYKKTSNAVMGVGLGVVAGVTVAAVSSKMMGKSKRHINIKKTAGKAVHTVGSIIGDVEKMLR